MASKRIIGNESWQELRARALTKYNRVRARRGEGTQGHRQINIVDLVLLNEASFLLSLSDQVRECPLGALEIEEIGADL